MKILIAGSSGLVGTALIASLREAGHQVTRLLRTETGLPPGAICWDPQHAEVNPAKFEGHDVLINLAGENISTGPWTDEKKKKIRDSRVLGTHMLSELIAQLENPPKLVINASAIGYYGNRGDEILQEGSRPGEGFLADLCRDWEAATEAAEKKGIRVVKMRIGVVLSREGGALARMLTPFKMGLGGVLGSGDQYISWITLDDLVGIIQFVMDNASIHGALNAVSPNPVTNREFTKTLGKVLKRPTILPLPAFAVKLLMGEMGESLLLGSSRVIPNVLMQAGYSFQYADLEKALQYLIKGK